MKLFNIFSKTNEPLFTSDDDPTRPITVYTCGITPYDTTHLGHAFTYVVSDILIRYLEYLGREVIYVQNVTDIDDDILRRAERDGDDWIALGNRWTTHFIEDLIQLNVRPPDHYPRATETIPEIINHVQRLIDAEVAYAANGSVYFHVAAWPEYGKLCGLSHSEMLPVANERGNNPNDPNKKDPLDFILWQAKAEGEPSWESPWGAGRPGWHIECSSMSSKFLGDSIDIHSGGGDLLFPHHESEIAQMEPITGKTFVRFWLHAAMVRHEGEKMSKSLGNLVWARDLLKTHSEDALRMYMAGHHYQVEWAHDPGQLDWSARVSGRISKAAGAASGSGPSFSADLLETQFRAAMEDNLNSPKAVGILDELAIEVLLAAQGGQDVSPAQHTLRQLSAVFGLRLETDSPEARVRSGWAPHLAKFKN
jgi:L-cysteine:1D-myo-inositol 2-amino-2-deoxy-alpha-D-glucopyranoside ligase